MKELLLVGLGGLVGSMARYQIGVWLLQLQPSPRFPLGTFIVNFIGCLAIGLLAGAATRYNYLTPQLRLFLMTGLLGGFTTFSALGLDAVLLFERGAWHMAALYVGASVVLGLGAVRLGYQLF